jgi:hypothetical protein
MTDRPAADPATSIHRFWWLHDAQWYQGVARRFGQEAANEINAEALRFMARRVAAWCAKEHGIRWGDSSLAEFVERFQVVPRTMFPAGMVKEQHFVRDDTEWETVVSDSFALKMLRAAGTLEGYRCACLEMRAGWFEGVGLPVQDTCVECARTGGEVCRFRAVVTGSAGEPARPAKEQGPR